MREDINITIKDFIESLSIEEYKILKKKIIASLDYETKLDIYNAFMENELEDDFDEEDNFINNKK